MLLENTPEYIFLIAGAALCGPTVVGINPTRRGAELAADIRGTDCAMIVTDGAYGGLLDGIGHGVPRILDAGGVMLNPQEAVGEIVSRGAAARFEGYYNNPEASRDRLRDGDFWTGDLGYRDEQGFYWFAGRTADWLRVDAENFAAAPVERILCRFPGVTAAAVYAVPDPVTGDQVMAALELPGSSGGEFDAAAFRSFLGEQPDLGTKWAPRLIRITADLPVTATHKISKPALRRMLWHGEDPVYERAGAGYVLMTADRKAALETEYARHGRDHLLRL